MKDKKLNYAGSPKLCDLVREPVGTVAYYECAHEDLCKVSNMVPSYAASAGAKLRSQAVHGFLKGGVPVHLLRVEVLVQGSERRKAGRPTGWRKTWDGDGVPPAGTKCKYRHARTPDWHIATRESCPGKGWARMVHENGASVKVNIAVTKFAPLGEGDE